MRYPSDVQFNSYIKQGFCMRDKGYTTDDGLINNPGYTAYKGQFGKVAPDCAARGYH